jgi:filamentous hemagglutinin family protein
MTDRSDQHQEQQPSVGRSVHYVAYGTPGGEFPAGVCRAAIITEVTPSVESQAHGLTSEVGLCVLNPSGLFFNRNVPYDANKAPGTWHWSERV